MGKRYQDDYLFSVLGKFGVLSKDEETELARKMRGGNKTARAIFIQHNLRLVISIAKTLRKKSVPLSDTIQMGMLGLVRATKDFDWRRGVRFSTYATWWIRQAILRENPITQRMVRIPAYQEARIYNFLKKKEEADKAGGTSRSDEEVLDEMGLTKEEQELFRKAFLVSALPVSIDGPPPTCWSRPSERDATLGETIPDEKELTEEDIIERIARKEEIDRILNLTDLKEKERTVLRVLYGIDDGEPKTLQKAGEHFGVTRERIRQIEARALKKIRKALGVPEPPKGKKRRKP